MDAWWVGTRVILEDGRRSVVQVEGFLLVDLFAVSVSDVRTGIALHRDAISIAVYS